VTSIFVTGGSGVVGSALVRELVARGTPPRALARTDTSAAKLEALGATPVLGDVLSDLERSLEGAELVFHVAGVNEMCPSDPDHMYRVNVEGTRNVMRAARKVGVGRLVYTSSAATIGEAPGTVGTEDSPHRGWFLSHYERSKHLAERVAFEEAGDLDLVVVNPSSVQGPGRATGTGKLILDLLRGRLPALVETRLSVVDIDDCTRGHLLAAERGRKGERYLLNSFTLPIREAVALLEGAVGRSLGVRYLPGWVATTGAAALEAAFRLMRRKPPVCREMVRTLLHGHAYDGSKATRELGLEYTPPEVTIRRLVDWFRAEGLL
jgi:dihydroflavonol-4-reductase